MTTPSDQRDAGDRSLIQRVRKLLAMAEGTGNPNEADAFSRKAAELIALHRIDPERLRVASHDDLALEEFELGRGAYVRGRLAVLDAVAVANDCRVVFESREHGTVAIVAGFRSDLETTGLLYHSLHTQASSRMAAERRATPAATQRWRRSFLFGYAAQIAAMLSESSDEAQRHSPTGASALPALRERDERVREFVAERFGRVTAARPARAATVSGWQAGRDAASRADLGRARIAGRRAIGSGGRG